MGPLCAQPQEFVEKNSVGIYVRVSCLTKKEIAWLAKHAWVTFTSKFLVINCRFRPMPVTQYILAVTKFRSALVLARTVKKAFRQKPWAGLVAKKDRFLSYIFATEKFKRYKKIFHIVVVTQKHIPLVFCRFNNFHQKREKIIPSPINTEYP